MQKSKVIAIISISLFISVPNMLYAWDNERTHPALSEMAARKSILGLPKNYLSSLGFSKGLDEKINGKEAFKWIREGAYFEDEPVTRPKNHFHNPLKSWDQAGLNDFMYSGKSMALWAQDAINEWNWRKIRDYYYFALTATTEAERQAYFAQVFRGLGQQMHLIQDAAQPDHVRNDAHVADAVVGYDQNGIMFETWAKRENQRIVALAAGPSFTSVLLNISRYGLAPITRFIDTDQYNGTAPSTSLSQGLAEYTNANFASDNTIFTEDMPIDHVHYFPYPRKSSTNLQQYINQSALPETVTAEDGIPDTAFWIVKNSDGERIDHFVKPAYLTNNVYDVVGGGFLYNRTFYRDERCHEDYAKLLIPRAVGYSAGLLNYFFRGETEAVTAEAIEDALGNIKGVKLKVGNKTPNEGMGTGKMLVAYRYKPPGSSAAVYRISEEVPLAVTIPSGTESPYRYHIPFKTPIPSNARDKEYVLVYKGRLGGERDAVAAGAFKIKQWPRGGILLASFKGRTAVIKILNKAATKSYSVTIPYKEYIVKAAFDEGAVDTVRILSKEQAGEEAVWRLHTYTYEEDGDLYQKALTEKAFSFDGTPRTTQYGISYIENHSDPHYDMRYLSGLIEETTYRGFAVWDFFVPVSGETQYLTIESMALGVKTPLIKTHTRDYKGTYTGLIWYGPDGEKETYECTHTIYSSERHIEGDGALDGCTSIEVGTETYSDSRCGKNASWNETGECVLVGRLYSWGSCDSTYGEGGQADVQLHETLQYGGLNKKEDNPRYNGGGVWRTRSNAPPCLALNEDALYFHARVQGTILSDGRVVLNSEVKRGRDEPLEKKITVEPDGIPLKRAPILKLRQTGGYSMIEEQQDGTLKNHTGFVTAPEDKPVLLNAYGDGFHITARRYFNTTWYEFRVGTNYDEGAGDFTETGDIYHTVNPEAVMDVMVEYE